MKLNLKAAMISAAVIWALMVLFTGLMNIITEGYGEPFLKIMASVYPGYDASGSITDLFSGFLYALFDGGICGLAFAFLYNLFLNKNKPDEDEWKKRQPGFDTPPIKPEA